MTAGLEHNGFVPLISVTNFACHVNEGVIVKVHQVSVDACADSLQAALILTQLSQVVLTAEVEKLDSMIEQTASRTEELQIDSDGQHPYREDEMMRFDVQKIIISKKTTKKEALA